MVINRNEVHENLQCQLLQLWFSVGILRHYWSGGEIRNCLERAQKQKVIPKEMQDSAGHRGSMGIYSREKEKLSLKNYRFC